MKFKSRALMSFVLALFLQGTVLAEVKTAVGKPGDWVNTVAGAVLDGKIYTVEQSGRLYATDPASGTWTAVGEAGFSGGTFLVALNGALYFFDGDGSIFRVDPSTGAREQVGRAGDWINTIAAAAPGGKICTVEASGKLYVTDPATGAWSGVGEADFGNTAFAVAVDGRLYTIEKGGAIYEVSVEDGSWKPAGNFVGDVAAAAALNGQIYAAGLDGSLQVVDPASGEAATLAADGVANAQFIFACGNDLLMLDRAGNLFSVSTSSQATEAVPAAAPATSAPEAAAPVVSEALKAGELTFVFQGKWIGDTSTFEQDPNYKTTLEFSPEIATSLLEMIRGVKMQVTLDGITMEVMGEKQGPYAYTIISAEDNRLTIETTDGPDAGSRADILFLDRNRIRLLPAGADAAKGMFLKKE
ncbi:MAG: PQQ-binding-like beta-propeller repeat protein [Kiritimatiellia bacterium]